MEIGREQEEVKTGLGATSGLGQEKTQTQNQFSQEFGQQFVDRVTVDSIYNFASDADLNTIVNDIKEKINESNNPDVKDLKVFALSNAINVGLNYSYIGIKYKNSLTLLQLTWTGVSYITAQDANMLIEKKQKIMLPLNFLDDNTYKLAAEIIRRETRENTQFNFYPGTCNFSKDKVYEDFEKVASALIINTKLTESMGDFDIKKPTKTKEDTYYEVSLQKTMTDIYNKRMDFKLFAVVKTDRSKNPSAVNQSRFLSGVNGFVEYIPYTPEEVAIYQKNQELANEMREKGQTTVFQPTIVLTEDDAIADTPALSVLNIGLASFLAGPNNYWMDPALMANEMNDPGNLLPYAFRDKNGKPAKVVKFFDKNKAPKIETVKKTLLELTYKQHLAYAKDIVLSDNSAIMNNALVALALKNDVNAGHKIIAAANTLSGGVFSKNYPVDKIIQSSYVMYNGEIVNLQDNPIPFDVIDTSLAAALGENNYINHKVVLSGSKAAATVRITEAEALAGNSINVQIDSMVLRVIFNPVFISTLNTALVNSGFVPGVNGITGFNAVSTSNMSLWAQSGVDIASTFNMNSTGGAYDPYVPNPFVY